MSIMRIHKTKNFTVMSNHHFKEKDMSLKAKGLISLMLSLPDDWNYSIAGLVKLSKDGKDSVMSALAELEKFGYLKRTRLINSKGQFAGVEYDIFEDPQAEIPVAENPNSDKENAEKLNAENQSQLNTKVIKELNDKELLESNTEEEEEFSIILSSIVNKDLKQLYKDYIEMRKTIKAPLTKRGLEMLINRCERLSDFNIEMQKILLETAIINNWKNVYSPKERDMEIKGDDTLDKLRRFYLD